MAKGKDKPKKETKKPPQKPKGKSLNSEQGWKDEGPVINAGIKPHNYPRTVQV